MAAYAALVSLVNTLDNVQGHRRFSISLDNNQVQSLREKLDFLLDFIQTTSTHFHGVTMSQEAQLLLETQIASAAFAAEDVIESHIVHHIHAAGSMISLLDLQTLIQDMDSLKEKVIISAKEQTRFIDMQQQQQPTHPTSSSTLSSTPKSSRMVGLNDELIRLLDELTGHQSSLQVIPIVGMGGIGKTTLARYAYEHPLIVQHFDIRAWVTVSQQYTVSHIFSKLVSCESSGEADEHELGEQLYKRLIGRRYLIILDDIWSIEAWHSIKRFFPDNSNTSRVVVTTRVLSIATQFGTPPFRLEFLDENKSWELFCENTFPGEGCTRELEELGKKIAKKCKGLPLLIVVIGALVRKSSSMEYWENISENIHSISSLGEEESLDILSLSYIHLPAHLKPCFLHMGTFPEDYWVNVSQLVKLWVAEGFVKPSKTQSLEEVAEGYVNELVDRNLIYGWSDKLNGEVERCSIHDLLRDLCLEKAEKQNFLCVMRPVGDIRQGIDTKCCFVFNQGRVSKPRYLLKNSNIVESAFLARSLASYGDSKFNMLRVLGAPFSNYGEDYILKQVNLRYISIRHLMDKRAWDYLHSSISLLWNLQTLIMTDPWIKIVAPREIWEMPQLRHVQIGTIWLPDPPPLSNRQQDDDDDEFVMRNLKTLGKVLNLTEEACKRIPSVKRLKLVYYENSVKRIASCDFGRLHKLESLDCQFDHEQKQSRVDLLQDLTFPSSLQELHLRCCYLNWEDLTMIGLLPRLRLLRLQKNSMVGSEWNPVEGEFLHLRCLELGYCNDLIKWNADNSHFPLLEKLILRGLRNLNEIPSDLGEIPTLVVIDLYECSESSSVSAVKILDQQQSCGNEGLGVQIGFKSREKLERFKEKIEQFESSTSNSLELRSAE